jgi:capsular polysaccharide biosynthesis protein
MSTLEQHIEVIIFTADSPVTSDFISEMLSQIHGSTITPQQLKNILIAFASGIMTAMPYLTSFQ